MHTCENSLKNTQESVINTQKRAKSRRVRKGSPRQSAHFQIVQYDTDCTLDLALETQHASECLLAGVGSNFLLRRLASPFAAARYSADYQRYIKNQACTLARKTPEIRASPQEFSTSISSFSDSSVRRRLHT